jgi:UDP-3-O-[3-hydroxymyristoyl] N-acetylglucosamine deacetylase
VLVLPDGASIDLIEHLAAAVGGLGAFDGVAARVFGGEIPLLDGGALAITHALGSLEIPRAAARSRIAEVSHFETGGARYELRPGDHVDISVEIDFAHPAIASRHAAWSGEPTEFSARIAPARTFGFARDAASLRASGRAKAVDLESVVVFEERALAAGSELRGEDEPARHKLLDLVGDLTLHGGPPLGSVRAFRPGHTANHLMMRAALASGAIVPIRAGR